MTLQADVDNDTIVAIATPEGRGGVGVVRVSGALVSTIARGICASAAQVNTNAAPTSGSITSPAAKHSSDDVGLIPRTACLTAFTDANDQTIDQGIALYFPAPNSYTGEDVLELQGHGGPVVLDLLVSRVLELGARQARPGEFTERAFLNDKLDLSQAEAVCDLINSSTEAAAKAAVRSLQGKFSNAVYALTEQLIELRIYMEAALDFPEEEIDFLASEEMRGRAESLNTACEELMGNIRQGQLLRDGYTLVLTGKPNAGKSSVLNQLTGADTAIVTEIEGTTRDLVRAEIEINGLPVQLIDTAGLRASEDPVEQEGIKRAAREVLNADRILWIVDSTELPEELIDGDTDIAPLIERIEQSVYGALSNSLALIDPQELSQLNIIQTRTIATDIIFNKIDLANLSPSVNKVSADHSARVVNLPIVLEKSDVTVNPSGNIELHLSHTLNLSASSGAGFDSLRNHILQCVGYESDNEAVFIARRRHIDALKRATDFINTGFIQLQQRSSPELAAEDFRSAQNCLSEITGEFSSDDLLGRIFAGFCIGK